jgi:hypothetical protein
MTDLERLAEILAPLFPDVEVAKEVAAILKRTDARIQKGVRTGN